MLSDTAATEERGTSDAKGSNRTARLWLWAILVAGVVLRLAALGHKSFWVDEIASVVIAQRTGSTFWYWVWHEEGNMAAYYVMLHEWLHFGVGEGAVRLLSLIPGVGAVPVMYGLGARLFGRKAGLLAAGFLALNACSVVVSQEARAYSFLVLGVLASTYFFVQLIERPTYSRAWIYGLVAGLTFYFQYFGILVPIAHGLSLVALPANRRPWNELSAASAIMAIAGAPVLWMVHAQNIQHIAWVQPASWLELYHLGGFLAAGSGKAIGAVLLAVDLALIFLCLRKLRSLWGDRESKLDCWRYGLMASGLIAPGVMTLLASIAWPVFYHRFLIICLPAWILMMAAGVQEITSRRWRTAGIAAVCALSVVSTVVSYTQVREDWRGVARYLMAQAGPEDVVFYHEPLGYMATEHYRTWLAGEGAPRPRGIKIFDPGEHWETPMGGASRVWLVLYRTKLDDQVGRAIDAKLASQFSAEAPVKFRGVTVVEYRAKP
jgi:mannosyltransferase